MQATPSPTPSPESDPESMSAKLATQSSSIISDSDDEADHGVLLPATAISWSEQGGYGFALLHETNERVFIHRSAIESMTCERPFIKSGEPLEIARPVSPPEAHQARRSPFARAYTLLVCDAAGFASGTKEPLSYLAKAKARGKTVTSRAIFLGEIPNSVTKGSQYALICSDSYYPSAGDFVKLRPEEAEYARHKRFLRVAYIPYGIAGTQRNALHTEVCPGNRSRRDD